jgi:hypothetical protein
MSKIEKLSPEQEAYLPIFRQEYLDAALSGRCANRENLEKAIAEAYQIVNKAPPLVVILQSPFQVMLAIKFVKALTSKELGGQLGDQLRDQLWDQLGGQLRDQLWGQLRGQLRDQLGDQLGGQLWGQLRGQLRDQPIYDANYLWGSQDLYWIAWGKFAEHIGVRLTDEQSAHLELMRRIGFECEWWWPYEGFCFVSERPVSIKWDDRRLLHCEDGPAIEYADGYSLYAWHGLTIPSEWVIDKSKLTPKIALTWENVEQRRAACELLGWHRILDELNAKVIDEDGDAEIGTLVEVEIPDIGREKFLRVQCGTKRSFALPVPPEMQTALQAQSWTYGYDDVNEFLPPEIRT